eukprot:scaffold30303_cov38-Phaeocystis_antarctica.AAC.2
MSLGSHADCPRSYESYSPKPQDTRSYPASRKHPPVSGGNRPLCMLGVPPGRSRGIGGCARAPCVSTYFIAVARFFHLPIGIQTASGTCAMTQAVAMLRRSDREPSRSRKPFAVKMSPNGSSLPAFFACLLAAIASLRIRDVAVCASHHTRTAYGWPRTSKYIGPIRGDLP